MTSRTLSDGTTLTQREPEWDWIDRAIMAAHVDNEALRCSGCGNYLDVTAGTEHAYRVHESVCYGCRSIAEYQDMRGKALNRDGLRLWADPVPLSELQPQRGNPTT